MSQETDPEPSLVPQLKCEPTNTGNFLCLHTSPPLQIALHGMSALTHTRLSKNAFDLCLELMEAGVKSKALADIVLYTLKCKKDANLIHSQTP
ncbi:GD20564 [Drosophila simulans]|uniref:GD20564 n=2 Tax=Drosophila simulans TaxID=7240 RepID=B4QSA5_DROSI|nr:GD20564 [Drosophila simulans]